MHASRWPLVRTLRVASPGGRCPFAWAAVHAPHLREVVILPAAGARAEELEPLKACAGFVHAACKRRRRRSGVLPI